MRAAFLIRVVDASLANAILVGERQKRPRQPEIQRFTELLESLSPVQDAPPTGEQVRGVLPIAREYNLSAYDAAYLELSIRHGAPLATLEMKLRKGARKAEIAIFEAGTR